VEAKKNIKVEHDIETSENDNHHHHQVFQIMQRVKDDKLHTLNSKHYR
jgi:hypothetical protein